MDIKTNKIVRLTLSYAVIAFMFVIILYPILWVFGASITPGSSMGSFSLLPEKTTWGHYAHIFNMEESNYLLWYWNTLKVCLITMAASVLVVSLMAYAFSRYRFWGRKNGLVIFLILQMIPNFAALIAIFVLARVTGLVDTHLGLILIYVGGAIPMNTWLMKGYLDSIPRELDESARMDGAGHLRIFWQIIMPLAKPMVAVVSVFTFIIPFTDFILAKVLLRTPEQYTLAVGLYQLIARDFGSEYTTFAAGSILIAIPIAILFLSFQKYFVSGLTAGGTKG
ncbi:ABC transporter permease subunit [Pontibacillus yanchengensis]|uniref:ABC transporter permease subunit n=2 Tax=Pontibacillus yanchengensis TaxID=462910 RepID=A0ACC7VBU6_9BACI|nr:sugar ABC transporter permease [Pontibacillus yanchengensis]MYL32278.1 ABC transporter permease subunit [Pontibacillus yanchengensis]MYL52858.1 ABC transporter permease subunit [Pontibacillus yanchengensis]